MRETKKFFGLIVGGPESDVREYKELAASLHLTSEDVLFTGPIESNRVPIALAACDVVTMPFPSLPHYRTNMSPLKMFEYMAAGKPIITSDLPPIRDVLAEETAVFYPPNDISKLADAIQWSADHSTEVQARATRAQALVVRYDWTKRMERVLQAATNG